MERLTWSQHCVWVPALPQTSLQLPTPLHCSGLQDSSGDLWVLAPAIFLPPWKGGSVSITASLPHTPERFCLSDVPMLHTLPGSIHLPLGLKLLLDKCFLCTSQCRPLLSACMNFFPQSCSCLCDYSSTIHLITLPLSSNIWPLVCILRPTSTPSDPPHIQTFYLSFHICSTSSKPTHISFICPATSLHFFPQTRTGFPVIPQTLGFPLPQGLCTSCFLWLNHSFPGHLCHLCLSLLRSPLKCHLIREAFLHSI